MILVLFLKKKFVIYKFQNLIDGKIYIGKTARTLSERLKEHLKKSIPCYIDRAINKYGIENFDFDIIADADTEKELNKLEKFFIKFFGCKFPDGYNLTDGGEGILGYKAPSALSQRLSEQHKGRPVTQKQRQAISKKLKEREFTAEHKANISAAKLGHSVDNDTREKLRNANLEKKHSAATRLKMSNSNKNKRAVICQETGKIFESIRAAAKWCGVYNNKISVACKNQNRTAGDYHWQYADQKEEK